MIKKIRKGAFLVATVGLLLSSFSVLLPQTAHAAGETYTWQDHQTIAVNGGSLSGPTTLTMSSQADILPNQAETFQGGFPITDHGQACTINIFLALTNPDSGGVITGASEQPMANANGTSCTGAGALADSYKNSSVSIGGTRQGAGTQQETQAQKQVMISVNPQRTDNLPDSVDVSIKNTSSGATKTITLTNHDGSYIATTHLNPGTYKLCANPDLGTSCRTFTKEKFKQGNWELGERLGSDVIDVTVNLDYNTGGADGTTAGPVPLTLYKADGTQLDTAKTDSIDVSGFDAGNGGSTDGTIANHKVILHGQFKNVPANTPLKVCAGSDTTNCKDVTRTYGQSASVTLNLDSADSLAFVGKDASADQQTDFDRCVSSNFFGWMLCQVYNIVGSSSDWIFQNIVVPLLKVKPVSLDTTSQQYKIWSGFRIYGDIFLIIALLVIVFGEAIGGGLIDAYTAKKVLPRLLAAAILINLSIYIVALLVDIGNILGGGIGELITKPLGSAAADQAFHITLDGVSTGKLYGTGAAGVLLGLVFHEALADAAIGFLLSAGGIIFFGFAAMALTLLVRAGALNILLLISPVAFALYCLPNTEKYFRKWWDVLLELILIYPFVVVFIAAGQLLAVTINLGHESSGVVAIISFVLQFLPLLFIPFAFRLASKTLGRMNEALHGLAMKGHEKSSKSWAQQYNANAGKKALQRRAEMYHSLNASAQQEGRSKLGGMTRRFGARVIGGYNIEGAMSATRAAEAKEVNDQIATGRDEEIRGLTVNKKWAMAQGELNEANGFNNGYMRRGDDGQMQFKTLGGAWVDEAQVDQGHHRWKNNTFAQQAALSYEMRKANTDEDRAHLSEHFYNVANGDGGWGMSKDQADGAWIGAAFENQNNNLQFKYAKRGGQAMAGNATTGEARDFDYNGYVEEVYQKRGSYAMSNMDATSIDRLTQAYQVATESGDVVQQQKLQAIAMTMQDRMGGARDARGGIQPTGADGTAEPSGAAPLGAGHVYEAMNRFVTASGVSRRGGGGQPPQIPGQGNLF